jgi:copper homeostasis protein
MALLEVCCGNPGSVDAAVAGGARRIELCASLELDGLTPPVSWLREAKAKYPALRVHVLIRSRAGDFVYTPEEVDTMVLRTEEALKAGADGIVIGALTPAGDIDLPAMERLVSAAGNVSVTFHRAFDVCTLDPFDALETIISLGCTRLLTSGMAENAWAGRELIARLVQAAGDRLIILAGRGVNPENVNSLAAATGAREFHGTALP